MAFENISYLLIRDKDNKEIAKGAFVKYYSNAPYIAFFESYPVSHTNILICKKLWDDEPDCGYLKHRLVKADEPDKAIMYCIPQITANTEKEANEAVEKSYAGSKLLRQRLEEFQRRHGK